MSIQEFFAQLYAHADVNHEPATRRALDERAFCLALYQPGRLVERPNRNVQHRGGCLPDRRADAARGGAGVCLRSVSQLAGTARLQPDFSHNGDEVTFATIGNASTAEGMFWESVNAIGVLKAPAVITIYDDGYGISVPNQFQMVKENIGTIAQGF